MGLALEESGFHPREPALERGWDRGDQSPRPRGTAQERGLPRVSRGCPDRRLGTKAGLDREGQWGRVEIVAL